MEIGDIKPSKNHRNPDEVIEQRQHRLYLRQMDGLTPRQLVLEHVSREGISKATGWRDWKAVQAWNETDFAGERAEMVSRLTAARWRLFNKSFAKGHYQTAASVLDGLSKTCGDGTEFSTAEEVKLNISIEPMADK
jgi:hypothetical protein